MGLATATTAGTFESESATEARSFVPSPRLFWFLLAAYFVVHVITRTLVTEAVGIDEADQLVRGQSLRWGYGPQAPLYTWLMTFFLHTFGSSVFSLALLRELMLFGIYALTYLNTRTLTNSHTCGVVAALILQFYPTFVWESQRELTHSIVASCMILLALLAFQGMGRGRWWVYAAFGFSGGLAILSKYNAAVVYAALLIAALTIPSLRSRVLDGRIGLALGTTILVVLPNASWALRHPTQASGSMYKFGIHETMPWLQAVKTGLWVWVETAGLHILPLIVLFAVLFWRPVFSHFGSPFSLAAPKPGATAGRSLQIPEVSLLWRVFLILNVFVILTILGFKVTAFKDRWMQPLFVWLPILLVLGARPLLAGWRLQTIIFGGTILTLIMAIAVPGRLLLTEKRGRRDVLNAPFRSFARQLSAPINSADRVIAGDYWLAGNLVLWFPSKHVHSFDLDPPPPNPRNAVFIWDASRRQELPPAFTRLVSDLGGTNAAPRILYFEEKWKFHNSKVMRLGVIHLE